MHGEKVVTVKQLVIALLISCAVSVVTSYEVSSQTAESVKKSNTQQSSALSVSNKKLTLTLLRQNLESCINRKQLGTTSNIRASVLQDFLYGAGSGREASAHMESDTNPDQAKIDAQLGNHWIRLGGKIGQVNIQDCGPIQQQLDDLNHHG